MQIDTVKIYKSVIEDNGEFKISVYQDSPADNETIQSQLKRLAQCFPATEQVVVRELYNRILFHKFSRQRLIDAVDNVIDTNKYKTFNVADIISYDKTVAVYNHKQICDMAVSNKNIWNNIKILDIDQKKYYICKEDFNKIIFDNENTER